MSWLIALAGALIDLGVSLFVTVAALYTIGPGTRAASTAIGLVALLAGLSGPVCAYLGLRAAARGAAPGRVLAIVAVPPLAALALAALASALESLGFVVI